MGLEPLEFLIILLHLEQLDWDHWNWYHLNLFSY